MKRFLVILVGLVILATLDAQAQTVTLNTDGLDTAYVESIVKRSQKIVDGLTLDDALKAENVRNIIANRYFPRGKGPSQCCPAVA